MSNLVDEPRIRQVGQDQRIQLANNVTIQATLKFLRRQTFGGSSANAHSRARLAPDSDHGVVACSYQQGRGRLRPDAELYKKAVAFLLPDSSRASVILCLNLPLQFVDESRRAMLIANFGTMLTFGYYFHELLMRKVVGAGFLLGWKALFDCSQTA